MLSMGEDLKDEGGKAIWSRRITFTKMLIIFSPC
jgi:hypothetical protein